MCEYRGYDFGARYPDSCCIDGYLWDLDSCEGDMDAYGNIMLTHGGDMPCPQCNHEMWIWGFEEQIYFDGAEAFENGLGPEHNPYIAPVNRLRYPADKYQFRRWWDDGYRYAMRDALKQIAEVNFDDNHELA